MKKARLAVFASGSGSNYQAIVEVGFAGWAAQMVFAAVMAAKQRVIMIFFINFPVFLGLQGDNIA